MQYLGRLESKTMIRACFKVQRSPVLKQALRPWQFHLFSSLAAAGLWTSGCRPSRPPAASPPPPPVTARQATQREVTEWDEYPGRLDAVEMVEVRARVTGYLQSVHFKDGAEVRKGDLLFVIDPLRMKRKGSRGRVGSTLNNRHLT